MRILFSFVAASLLCSSQLARAGIQPGCRVFYEDAAGVLTKGPSGEFQGGFQVELSDANYEYRVWQGAKPHSLYINITRREDGKRVASFAGTVEPGEDQEWEVLSLWMSCRI